MITTYKNFRITSTFKGDKKADWGSGIENWNYHIVKITNTETDEAIYFNFWTSVAHPDIETDCDLLNAFYCFASDAVSGNMDFSDFCSEFGCDEDSRRAERIWRACKHSAKSLERIYDGDIYNLCDELAELAS